MSGLMFNFLFIAGIVVCLNAGTVERIYIFENRPALKGSNIQLVCEMLEFVSSDTLNVYKTDTRLPSSLAGIKSLIQCFPSICLTQVIQRYTFMADSSNVFINISSLKRSEDQKWWTCAISNQRKDMLLSVITIPTSLHYKNPPNQSQDLSENAIQLKCSTGCSYPRPTITWYYSELHNDSLIGWASSGIASYSTLGCSDSEKIYSSTLSLPRYTTFPGNLQKTVKFKCSIQSFTGMQEPLYTNYSTVVQFAVRVSIVTLKDGTKHVSGLLHIVSGINKTLTCETSASRPEATIVWYIGTEEKQRSTLNTVTFIPDNSYNNSKVYCKAFNTQPEGQAVSSYQSALFVQEQSSVKSFYIGENMSKTNATFEEYDVDIKLTCVIEGMPASIVDIMFEETIIKRSSNTSILKYTFHAITCTNSGDYICRIIDIFGKSTNKSVLLNVECAPRPVRQILQNITSELGVSVSLTFTAIAYPEPGPKGFKWYKEDRSIWIALLSNEDFKIASVGLETNLTIANVSREHFGGYRVTVNNRIGSYNEILYLSERDKSSDLYTCICAEKCSVTLSIVLGVVCVLCMGYSAGVTIMYKRNIYKKDPVIKSRSKSSRDNMKAGSRRKEQQDYFDDTANEDSSKQYTELAHYTNAQTTYDHLHA